jgi:uncharacterized membrane protein (UPF0127 family)
MKQISLVFAILVASILLAYWSSQPGNLQNFIAKTPGVGPSVKTETMKVGENEFIVEVAENEDKRRAGLSGRESLEEGHGMLFVLENKDSFPSFWMKGMFFPIDIIWIDNAKVTEITPDVQPADPNAAETQIPRYTPKKGADHVLELPAGTAKSKGIMVGDKVDLP